ncbi:hypothetical protein Tco_0646663 [Tanacetum coccineum]
MLFVKKFHILEEIHPVLTGRGATMHERPARKIGLYTRFFDFANFILPLSTFFVDILRHFRINISQLSVIGGAKVSHFEILCRVYGIIPTVGLFRCFYVNSKKNGWMSFSKRSDNAPVCYTKPLDSLKNWNNHFFWVDDFVCPALFLWHTAKHVTRDPVPVAADFNAQDYATFVAHPFPFWKFPEEFMCLLAVLFLTMPPLLLFCRNIGNESLLLETTVGRTVPLLLVAPDRAESELEASVDRLFDEGGSGNQTEQGDSAGGRQGADISGLRSSGCLLGCAECEVTGCGKIPTLPLANIFRIRHAEEFVISLDSSHHSGANVAEAKVDSLVRSSVPVMTAVTTVTSTVDPAFRLPKEKLWNLPVVCDIIRLVDDPPWMAPTLFLSKHEDTSSPLTSSSLLNTPPSFDICLGDLDRSRLILENILAMIRTAMVQFLDTEYSGGCGSARAPPRSCGGWLFPSPYRIPHGRRGLARGGLFVITHVFTSSQKAKGGSRMPEWGFLGGKSRSAIQWLLAGVVLNAEVRGGAIPTLPFMISSVSATPESEDGDHTNSVAEPNLRNVSAPQRFVISSDSSHHSGANVAEAKVDSLVRSFVPVMTAVTTVTSTVDPALIAKEKHVEPSPLFVGSSSAGGTDPPTVDLA